MKKRILAILVALVLVFAFIAACADEPATEAPATDVETPAAGDTMRGIFITQDLSNASQAFSASEFERLMGDFDAEVIIAGGDVADNIANIERAIAENLDFIFINPNDILAIIPALERAREEGIIVGLFSSQPPEDVPDYPFDFFAGSDDVLGGIQAGEFVMTQFPDGANFVEVGGQAGHIAAVSRHDGFRQGIDTSLIIELDYRFVTGPWEAAEARSIMEDFLVMYGDEIDIVWTHWDNGASGVIEAVLAAGIDPTDIFIIGYDGNSVGYQQVLDGYQALSVGQSFTNMASESLRMARVMFDGGTITERLNWVPVDMVTIDSIHDFPWPEW
ncbi:MAG: sugar ABC transporter substrate-binding protein [Oscillospiraceae bacterium]|nr:sugar ABC transporter substrate-binding protein [Oscillospiraceae bacterium]